MSARGISVFYGASNVETAIPEIRPPVGCKVVSAGFRLIRPLRLLNLPALESVWASGSMFDPDYINKLAQVAFLRTLSGLMTDPVLPGEEDFLYIPTQVIAEYLADSPQLNLDGLIYPSVQNSELIASENYNVVLFHKASRVQFQPLPPERDCEVSYGYQYGEDNYEPDICVTQTAEQDESEMESSALVQVKTDTRLPALKIELDTVNVHQINRVCFGYSSLPVSRRKHIMAKSGRHPDTDMPANPPLHDEDWADDIPC